MNEIIKVDIEKCVGCNACIRTCPASEANVVRVLPDGRTVIEVNSDRCITCGECIRNCMHGARDYSDDTEKFFSDIAGTRDEVVIVVTPSIKATFNGVWRHVLEWFQQRYGIKNIFDVSLGADICTWAHLKAIEENRVQNIISQPCAAIVNYVQKYQHALIPNLSPVHSPILCTVVYIKKYLNINKKIAVLSPCIAKKTEFMQTGLVDYNVTFEKLKKYFENECVFFNNRGRSEFEFTDHQGLVGSIYPRPGGLKDNLLLHNPELSVVNSEGVHRVYPELDEYSRVPDMCKPEVFDVLNCEFGCNVGPACGHSSPTFDVLSLMRDVEKGTKKKRSRQNLLGPDRQFKGFDKTLHLEDFTRGYVKMTSPIADPDEDHLDEIYKSMNKYSKADRSFNCHACGYLSCRQMAIAIYKKLNVKENCIWYAKHHMESALDAVMLRQVQEMKKTISEQSEQLAKNIERNIDISSTGMTRMKSVSKVIAQMLDFCGTDEHFEELSSALTQISKLMTILLSDTEGIISNEKAAKELADGITQNAQKFIELVTAK